ncbi:hypothetical protein GMYAFLOJ_CDS0002 [Microbacterium phage phiMiGM15]
MTEIAPLPYGYVVGRFLLVQGDSSLDNDRYPDAVPARGSVRLTPVSPRHLITTSPPATAIALPVSLIVNDEGFLIDPGGAPGVWLVAGQYDVSFSFNGITHPPFRIAVTEEHTLQAPLDLTLAAPLNPAPDIKFVVNEAVYTETVAARDAALAAAEAATAPTEEVVADVVDAKLAPVDVRLFGAEEALQGRLSTETLDDTFAAKAVQATVETGRLSPEGLSSTFVAFQKEDGTPLTAKRVIITVSNDGTSIADIKVVS